MAFAAIRSEQTLVELSQQFDVHANQKDQRHEGATGVFGGEAKAEPAVPKVDVNTLHAKIGELTMENDFFSRSARQGGIAGPKEMIDRSHKLSVVRQAKLRGGTTCSSNGSGVQSNTRKSTSTPTRQYPRPASASSDI